MILLILLPLWFPVLDPSQKDGYFKRYWGKELHAQVLRNAEQLVSSQDNIIPLLADC